MKAYKKISLSAHPDKGGDSDVFNEIVQAYKSLLAMQEEAEIDSKSIFCEYEVLLEKGGSGVGLGLSIIEDKVRNKIVISEIQVLIRYLWSYSLIFRTILT